MLIKNCFRAISVDQTTLTLTAGGVTGTITATVLPADATNKTVTWTSSNEAVATVAGGVVTPLTAGTTTITATTVDGSKTATCKVVVIGAGDKVVNITNYGVYETIQLAIAAAVDGDTIVLGSNTTVTETVRITSGQSITLDLNGKTVSSTLATTFRLEEGALNVVDTADVKGGISVSGEAFRVNGQGNSLATDAILNIGTGVNVTSSGDCCVFIYGKATLNTAGNLTSEGVYATIQGNGMAINDGTVINITGGSVTSTKRHTIYVPQNCEMNITGGEISSAGTAIEAKGGTLTISGGTISTSATSTSHVPNGNGGSAVGYALAVIDNAGYSGAQVTVSGGTFDGPVALLDDDSDATNNNASLIINAISAMPTSIQSILDQAGDGTTINLNPGDYGTLYLRQSELSRKVDVTDWAGDGDVERYREFKNISIVGTTGAKVDQIAVEAQLYPSTGTGHSNDNGENLSSYISISNLTIKNIEFTGDKPVAVNLQSIWSHSGVNGLTIDGCTLTGKAADKEAQTSFLLRADGDTPPTEIKDKTTNELIMTTGRSDLTVKNCTVDNVWMPINITEWNDITISNNHFSNSGRNDILITGPSVGDVNIIGNTLSNAAERSIRLNTITGKISITDNTIENCAGREIKDEDGTTVLGTSLMHISASGDGTTVILSGNSWNGLNDEAAVNDDNEGEILLESDVNFTVN